MIVLCTSHGIVMSTVSKDSEPVAQESTKKSQNKVLGQAFNTLVLGALLKLFHYFLII